MIWTPWTPPTKLHALIGPNGAGKSWTLERLCEEHGAKRMPFGDRWWDNVSADARFIAVENPENGHHPAKIAWVVGALRGVSDTAQVLITTHSPLVVNELRGEEVTIVTRDEGGTHYTRLCDVPGFEDAMKVYQPGEFWLAYCDGVGEKPLLEGRARA